MTFREVALGLKMSAKAWSMAIELLMMENVRRNSLFLMIKDCGLFVS